ncbi:hypothetical protein FHG87_013075 [Trinorchestia longiramus]|nr:hypothetical protein FHG87_013075 [Trinorchestia longiramus]
MRSVDIVTAVLLLASLSSCDGAAGFFDGFGGGKDKGKGGSPKHVYYVVHNPIYVQQKPKAYGHGGGYGGHGHGGGYGHGGGHGGGYGGGHFITYETAGGYGHKSHGYGHDIGYHRSDNSGEYDQLIGTGFDQLDRSGYKQHDSPDFLQEKTGYHQDAIVKSKAEYEYIGGHSGAFHVMDYGDKKDQKHG